MGLGSYDPKAPLSTPLLHEGHHASSTRAVRFSCPLARIASSLVHHSSPTFSDGLLGKVLGKATPGKGSLILSYSKDWRPVGDSNPCWCRERAIIWASRRTGHRPREGLLTRNVRNLKHRIPL